MCNIFQEFSLVSFHFENLLLHHKKILKLKHLLDASRVFLNDTLTNITHTQKSIRTQIRLINAINNIKQKTYFTTRVVKIFSGGGGVTFPWLIQFVDMWTVVQLYWHIIHGYLFTNPTGSCLVTQMTNWDGMIMIIGKHLIVRNHLGERNRIPQK